MPIYEISNDANLATWMTGNLRDNRTVKSPDPAALREGAPVFAPVAAHTTGRRLYKQLEEQ